MSQWSEKIPKENLSKTVSSTRYLFTSFRIQINNFRKSSKKFIIDLLTKNVALNLSGAIFFVGLGYSLKWWYKDQLFVVLLKQNLPALSESQQNTFWAFTPRFANIQGIKESEAAGESILNDEYQSWTPLIDRLDLYANHIGVKFKQPWQKHVYEQFIGVFGEPAEANICKQVLTTDKFPFTGDKDWWKDNTLVSNDINKFSTYTVYTPEKPIFRKKWFKLSPRTLSFVNQRVLNIVNKKTSLSFQGRALLPLSSEGEGLYVQGSLPFRGILGQTPLGVKEQKKQELGYCEAEGLALHSWERGKVSSTDKLSYPLQLTKELIGWQPSPNALILNSYLDEIPYKLENALQFYFPKKNSQLLSLSTSFRKSINSSYPRFAKEVNSYTRQARYLSFASPFQAPASITSEVCTARQAPRGYNFATRYPSILQAQIMKRRRAFTGYPFCSANPSLLYTYWVQKLETGHYKTAGVETQKGLVFDSSTNCKTSKIENDATRKNLELFKEITHFVPTNVIQRKFLMPTKQSETYFKKLHFFETKKLLQNHLASLVNSFPIDFVEKSAAIVESDKYRETVVENNGLKDSNGFVISLPRTSEALKGRASEMGNDFSGSNFFETNNDRVTSNHGLAKLHTLSSVYPGRAFTPTESEAGSNHHLVDVTKKVLAVIPVSYARQAPYSSQLGKASPYLRFPKGLRGWGMAKSYKAEGQKRGIEANRLAQLFTYSTVANAADVVKIKQLDPLLVLNTLGFTFNNFSPLTNPPILLSYGKLGVLSNGVTNIFKPGKESATFVQQGKLFQGKMSLGDIAPLPKGFFFAGKEKHTHKMQSKKIGALHSKVQNASVSFYFNPKNLNWVVFQQSTNGKFNLLLKKIVRETNKEIAEHKSDKASLVRSNNTLTSKMNVIPPGHTPLGVKKQKTRGNKEGACLAKLLLAERERGKSDASPLAKRGCSLPLARYVLRGKESEIKQLIDLIKTNRVINKVDNFATISTGNKINFKQKETKFETLNKINVVDKGINFHKNSRYMSGYVYPDIQSNSLKAHFYEWLGKNRKWMLWFSSHYLNDKPIGLDSKNLQSFCPSTPYPSRVELRYPLALAKRGYGLGVIAERALTRTGYSFTTHYLPQYQSATDSASDSQTFQGEMSLGDVALLVKGKPEEMQNKKGVYLAKLVQEYPEGIKETQSHKESGYAKCESNVYPYGIPSSLVTSKEKEQFLGNNHYIGNIEVPYKKFNHYLAKFPGLSDSSQFFTTLPQILCGNENLVNESQEIKGKSTLGEFLIPLPTSKVDSSIKEKGSRPNDSIKIVDKSEINKVFIQKNGCNSRKVAYFGIVVQRNKWTKDFQPFKDSKKLLDGASKSSIWGTLFLGPENPLTDRQCHFFGQKQLSTLDTNSLQRDYLRQLGKEILTQSNLKGYTELSKFSSIERTKILSLSKKVNSFFFKKRKYSYLLEPKDQWHLLFQEQLCTALEDCKKYPLSTSFEGSNTEKLKLGDGRIKVSAPLVMARFPKKLVHSLTSQFLNTYPKSLDKGFDSYGVRSNSIDNKLANHQLEQGTSWRPFCHLQRSSILKGRLTKNPSSNEFKQNLDYYHINFVSPSASSLAQHPLGSFHLPSTSQHYKSSRAFTRTKFSFANIQGIKEQQSVGAGGTAKESVTGKAKKQQGLIQQPLPLAKRGYESDVTKVETQNKLSELGEKSTAPSESNELPLKKANGSNFTIISMSPYWSYPPLPQTHYLPAAGCSNFSKSKVISHYPLFTERFSEEINALLCRNKNSFFYFPQKSTKNIRNNVVGIQNMSTSLLIQEPLNWNSWAVLNQWIFLIALLFWVEQTLLNNVFPALFALEQILLSAAGLKTGENNRTHVLRISKNETPKFQNLAGIDGLLGELSELVLFLRGQRNLGIAKLSFWKKWNKKNSYGVLLTGSPGTGKTFLVRALANEAKVPVLILSASTLTASKLNNNKPSWSIRHAFKRAKQLAPCILFIDEIDALGKSRGKIVTDINEIVADTNSASLNASFLAHKRMLTKSTLVSHSSPSPMGYMFSYEQFGQNCSNFNATLLNKWEYPLQSTILQEFNEINQNSLCQEKLVDILKIAGGTRKGSGASDKGTFTRYPEGVQESATGELIDSSRFKKESTNKTSYSRSAREEHQLPTLEKETTRGKFGPLTQLLVSMDGVSSFSGVLIMGATNRPELLDPALTRPGRFEKILRIDKPSEQNRIEILQLYSQNLGVQQQIPWSYLATRTIGLTTADLAVAMNYSSLKAIIQDSVHTLETIEYGLNCITRF